MSHPQTGDLTPDDIFLFDVVERMRSGSRTKDAELPFILDLEEESSINGVI